MPSENLTTTYLYDDGQWLPLPRDDIEQEIREGRYNPAPTPDWFVERGYYPRPVVFKAPDGIAEVKVYTQSSDEDKADYTFMCYVSIAGAMHTVFVHDTPNLVGLINEMEAAMRYSLLSEQEGPPGP